MTADIFGQRVNYDVDTMLNRLLKDQAEQRVVADDDRTQTGLADGDSICNGSQLGKVDQAVHGVGRSFDEDHRDAAFIRARAILMLLITYGLRAAEISGLQLDDLDWEREMLRVRCPKPGRTHLYPLSRGVAQTILRYLSEVRPKQPDRRLFLTLKAPIKPLDRHMIKFIVSTRIDRLGITGKRRGPHALRHAAAQHLLDQGLSMKAVGDYLGHRSVAATSVYAKVQLNALREVAETDLEGLV